MEELINKKYILEKYSEQILEKNKEPKNVYLFCKENNFTEKEFYDYFANFEAVEKEYLLYFFEESKGLIIGDENYLSLQGPERLLSLYYTFIEQLTLNRSLVLYILEKEKNPLKQISKLGSIKSSYLSFLHSLDFGSLEIKGSTKNLEQLSKLRKKGSEEIFWGNFIAIIKFWMKDSSPSFEKTDVFIEKSVAAGFELTEAEPFKKILDFGKFMWKENMRKYKG